MTENDKGNTSLVDLPERQITDEEAEHVVRSGGFGGKGADVPHCSSSRSRNAR